MTEMVRILKFTLGPELNIVTTGGIRRVLGVGWQKDDQDTFIGLMHGYELRIWVEAVVGDAVEDRFYAAVTGQAPPEDAEFIGTAVGMPYVAHVYRRLIKGDQG